MLCRQPHPDPTGSPKYLTLIDSIALLHQYQREIKTVTQGDQVIEYIDITREDIALANQLAHDVLGRSLDELPPPTRTLLGHLYSLVDSKINEEACAGARCVYPPGGSGSGGLIGYPGPGSPGTPGGLGICAGALRQERAALCL